MTIANESTADSNHNPSSKTEWSGSYAPTGKDWNVYCGDTREVLCRLPRNHYTCVITSPPYYWQRDYGVEGQIGIEPTVEGYVKAVCDVMDGVKDVLNPKGVLFLNLGDTYYSGKGRPKGMDRKHNGRRFSTLRAVDTSGLGPPKKTLLGMPWRVTLAMIDRGWILRSSIIWRRENAVPEPNVRDRPCRTYEFVFLFAKARQYRFSRRELRNLGVEDVWTIESQSRARREHPAVFPPGIGRAMPFHRQFGAWPRPRSVCGKRHSPQSCARYGHASRRDRPESSLLPLDGKRVWTASQESLRLTIA